MLRDKHHTRHKRFFSNISKRVSVERTVRIPRSLFATDDRNNEPGRGVFQCGVCVYEPKACAPGERKVAATSVRPRPRPPRPPPTRSAWHPRPFPAWPAPQPALPLSPSSSALLHWGLKGTPNTPSLSLAAGSPLPQVLVPSDALGRMARRLARGCDPA